MKHALLVAVCAASLWAMPSQAAPQARSSPERVDPLTASIRGRVTVSGSGAPVRGAEVRLSLAGGNRWLATTDGEGAFLVRDLPAGAYRLDASRAGFTSLQFGQRRPFDAPEVITLTEGSTFTANVVLPRGSAVYGRVVDQFGDPIPGTRVQAFRLRTSEGQRRLQTVGPGDQTDDTGAFRVYGLPPGDYYVAASTGAVDAVKRDPPIFYPGTASAAEAQIITLASGAEATADFQLMPQRNARVSGVVMSSSGAPIEAQVTLASEIIGTGPADPASPPTTFTMAADSGRNGVFTIDNVPPGPYSLTATAFRPGARIAVGPATPAIDDLMRNYPETVSIPIIVSREDLSGVALVTLPNSVLKGQFVPADGVIQPIPTRIRASVRAAHSGGMSLMQERNDGEFTLAGMSGPFHLEIQGMPEGWMVRSVTVDGVDVTGQPLDLKGRDASARIELTDRVGSISGIVQNADDVAGYSVVLFPDDPERWTYPSRYVRVGRPDTSGRFQITGLPPNDRYLAVAVGELESGDEQNPDVLEGLRGRATSFSLNEGEQRSVVLDAVAR